MTDKIEQLHLEETTLQSLAELHCAYGRSVSTRKQIDYILNSTYS